MGCRSGAVASQADRIHHLYGMNNNLRANTLAVQDEIKLDSHGSDTFHEAARAHIPT